MLKAEGSDFPSAAHHLSTLAFARYGRKIIDDAKLGQEGNLIEASLSAEGFDAHMWVLTCLTAISAIGTSAEADFNEIARQLDAANVNAN